MPRTRSLSRRSALVLGTGAAVVVGAMLAPTSGAVVGATAPVAGVAKTYAAGHDRGVVRDTVQPASLDSAIADSDTVGDYLRYTKQAAGLPVAKGSLGWKSIGPFGIDMPAGYSQSNERFARVAGMGSAIVADTHDKSGKTVYMGNMGGLWKSTDGGNHWKVLTDGKLARSAVGAVALDPARRRDIYVGTGTAYFTLSGDTPGTGVYVSHDGGRTFHRPAANVKGYGVTDIKVTRSAVYVGTVKGLWRSSDHGKSFHEVKLPTNTAHTAQAKGPYANWVSSIAVRPRGAQEITVAVGFAYGKKALPDGSLAAPGNGLYRSSSGKTFRFVPGTKGLTHPAASADPVGRISLSYGKGTGQNDVLWALVSDAGLTAKLAPAGADVVASTLGQSLNPTNTVLNGLYRSDDDGATWTAKATPQSLLGAPNSTVATIAALGYSPGVQSYYNNWVLADPVVPDRVYLGLEEVYQSTANTGSTPGTGEFTVIQRYADTCGFLTYFQNVTSGAACPDQTPLYGGTSTHPDQHAATIVALPGGKTRLFTGNDGGFFRQDSAALADGSQGYNNRDWSALNTLATFEPYHAARLPNGEYIGAFQDNGSAIFKPGKPGITVSGGDGVWVFATKDPDVFYTSSQGAALYVTKDHGHTITEIQPDLAGASFTSPIAVDPTDGNHLMAAGRDVQESLKGPDTVTLFDPVATGTIVKTDWTQSFDAGTSPAGVAWGATAIGLRGANAYVASCGTCRGSITDPKLMNVGVFTNVKKGCKAAKGAADCWHKAAAKGIGRAAVSKMVIDYADPRTVYVTITENNLIGLDKKVVGKARVMVSHDAGEHFSDITGNLPGANARGIVMRAGQLVVANDVGIFTAGRGGKKWSRLGRGLPAVRAYDLSIDPSGRYLTASMYGRGVWSLDFGSKAPSTNGPGAFGQPEEPSAPTGVRVPFSPGDVAVWALLALLLALGVRQVRAWRRPEPALAWV